MSVPSSPLGLLPAFAPNEDGDDHAKFKIHNDESNSGKLQWSPTTSKRNGALEEKNAGFYPTPVPTSSLHNSSSPTRAGAKTQTSRLDQLGSEPPLGLTGESIDDARSPLMSLPMLELSRDGTSKTIGRSSQSCNVALSSRNKLVSRVHARARYRVKDRTVVIDCLGWNGLTVTIPDENGGTKDYEIGKGQSLTADYVHGIKLNIRGERALVVVDDDETDDERPTEVGSSPVMAPAVTTEHEDTKMKEVEEEVESAPKNHVENDSTDVQSKSASSDRNRARSKSPSDRDTATSKSSSTNKKRANDKTITSEKTKIIKDTKHDKKELKRLLTNHLAFSRLSSTPLTTICKSNSTLAQQDKLYLRELLEEIECVGVIEREGKDASGRPLEEEYYYDPERDTDLDRKILAEQSKGHVGIRSCRKQHKQYYWKKPGK